MLTDPAEELLQEVFEVMDGILGDRPELKAATYFTEVSAMPPAYGDVPTVILGPGEAAMAHQRDEYFYVDRIGQAVEVYTKFALRWNAR